MEGLGIVFLEASACRSAGGRRPLGRGGRHRPDGVTGFVVDPNDVGAVATAAIELLTDPERAERMGAAGREWVEREWTWRHVHDTSPAAGALSGHG